tara:strand:+ start:511 stop:924 length:414 start_codon:yes stop_codon:yes gene_type:complete
MSNKPPAVRLATALFTAVWVLGAVKLVRSLSLAPSAGGHGFTIFAFAATYSVMALLIVYLWQGASWARGALFALFLVAIAPGLVLVLPYATRIPLLAISTAGQAGAAITGFYIVFREPAASWFTRPNATPLTRGPRR